MHIISKEKSLSLGEILLILEPAEATQLIGYLEQLLECTTDFEHHHLSDAAYQKEITICLHTGNDFSQFHPSIRAIIDPLL